MVLHNYIILKDSVTLLLDMDDTTIFVLRNSFCEIFSCKIFLRRKVCLLWYSLKTLHPILPFLLVNKYLLLKEPQNYLMIYYKEFNVYGRTTVSTATF
ncbi:hypothetical protein V1477_001469 [Vespula maculifrons]|uniref:Uncharacterized protein n=1 Tax=Vespula maculifrons TaxID=7453 RepID=A0ABD2CYT6_VESMC